MKQQIVFIHGGDTFDTYEDYLAFLKSFEIDFSHTQAKKWKHTLVEKLGGEVELIAPEMPNKINAKYAEWKIWFEKFIPYLKPGVILVGHSMGGIFLAQYLSENTFPKEIKGVFIVAAPFDTADASYSLADFVLPQSLDKLGQQSKIVHFYHSTDDPDVPYADFEKYKNKVPRANFHSFSDRQHFTQEEFPELIEDIKQLMQSNA